MNDSDHASDERLEIAKIILHSSIYKIITLKRLYPEYFTGRYRAGSLELQSDLNTSYRKWIEDYNISKEWIGDFPTNEIYNNYVRYCLDSHYPIMTKRVFFHVLETDFNI